MANFVQYNTFYRKVVVRHLKSLDNYPLNEVEDLVIPKGTLIHYLPDYSGDLGIDRSHCLYRNIADRVYVHHLTEMDILEGSPRSVNFSIKNAIQSYHRVDRNRYKARNLDKVISNDIIPTVINYSFLQGMYKYPTTNMRVYHEWYNLRNKLWEMVTYVGNRKQQFIRFKLPDHLPDKTRFTANEEKIDINGIKLFHSPEALDLLELWKILGEESVHLVKTLPEDVLKTVHLLFVESGFSAIIRLDMLLEEARKNSTETRNKFYRFLLNVSKLKPEGEEIESAFSYKDVSDKKVSVYEDIDSALNKVNELGSVGLLTSAEQNYFEKSFKEAGNLKNPFGEGVVRDLEIKPEDYVLKENVFGDRPGVVDKTMLRSSIDGIDKEYIKKFSEAHMVSSIMAMQGAQVAVKDIKVNKTVSPANKKTEYTIKLHPVGGELSLLKFSHPTINEDGTIFIGNNKCRPSKQRVDLPIVKISENEVSLSSYYGKLMITRNSSVSNSIEHWLKKKIIDNSESEEADIISHINYGTSRVSDVKLPRYYTAVSKFFSSMNKSGYRFYFDYREINKNFTEKEIEIASRDGCTLFGKNTKGRTLGMDMNDNVYIYGGDSNANLGHFLSVLFSGHDVGRPPIEFSEISVYNRKIGVGLAFMYRYGIERTLKMLNIPFRTTPSNARDGIGDHEVRIRFKDIAYIIDISDNEKALIVGSIYKLRKEFVDIHSNNVMKRHVFTSAVSVNKITATHLNELEYLWDMFVDPITRDVLNEMGEPTKFQPLLLRANELLTDDFTHDSIPWRWRGHERIAGLVYMHLTKAIKAQKSKRRPDAKIEMSSNAVWLDYVKDATTVVSEEANPIHHLKEMEVVTHGGMGGRTAVSMVKKSRGFKRSDLGIISEANADSDKVGIRTYLSPDAKIKNHLGMIDKYEFDEKNPTALLSTSSLLAPSADHDDSKRFIFTGIQNSHTVPCEGYETIPYTTGYDKVLANRCQEPFATHSKGKGIVTALDEDHIEVTYEEGTVQSSRLGVIHGSFGAYEIPHEMVTALKLNDKVTPNTIVTYNRFFFTKTPGDKEGVTYKAGVVVPVALMESSKTEEDSCVVHESLSSKFEAPMSKTSNLVVEAGDSVENLLKVGDEVSSDTIICTIIKPVQAGSQERDEDAIAALQQISSMNPTAGVSGKVSKIEVIYMCEEDQLSPSLGLIVAEDNKRRRKFARNIDKSYPVTGKLNESILVDGKELKKGEVLIKVNFDFKVDLNTADKIVIGNMLKSTISEVSTNKLTTESGEHIPIRFAYQSISDRIVESPIRTGVMIRHLKALSRAFVTKYRGQL